MSAERTMAVVRRGMDEIWNQGDLAVADVFFARGYVTYSGLIPDLIGGPEAIKVGVALYRTAFPQLYIMAESLVAEGETVELH